MADQKIKYEFEIQEDHIQWLNEMVNQYSLPDKHKVLRILLDFAKEDGDLDLIFDTIRCQHCG